MLSRMRFQALSLQKGQKKRCKYVRMYSMERGCCMNIFKRKLKEMHLTKIRAAPGCLKNRNIIS